MAEVLDALFLDYQQKVLAERDNLQKAEAAKTAAIRNIDRIEGAMIGIKDAIAQLNSSENQEGQAAECEMPQQGTEG